ncbi:radical SAM protein, partial [Candidatus Poribacteria bacterium]
RFDEVLDLLLQQAVILSLWIEDQESRDSMSKYFRVKKGTSMPRLPFEGEIDLTYRCNNNCHHCWVRIQPGATERHEELALDELKEIVDEARKMGCRQWHISGGEPMLRPDFAEIFDYITSKCTSYFLNTNGTLITPEIARLMKRKGSKMLSLYGATAEVHDCITRNPGSFEATMRGFAYLREAGVGFTVQLNPMRGNCHQLKDMTALAESLSPYWKYGFAWLYSSGSGDPKRDQGIVRQRLDPVEIIRLNSPEVSLEEGIEQTGVHGYHHLEEKDQFFGSCIAERRSFHIDPYGRMTFCIHIKDPALRYDLRTGSFEECWEKFIPSLADKIRGGEEYQENCGSCEMRGDCYWCPVYSYLEHGRYSAKIEYLCSVARESRRFKADWQKNNRRYYQIAGITIQVDSDLPITDTTFHPKFKIFQVDGPGEDTITIRHHFSSPDFNDQDLGEEVYRESPWTIYRKGDSWIYTDQPHHVADANVASRIAVFSHDYTATSIYNNTEEIYHKGGLGSLTLFPTDQILLAQVLADREGCYLHSGGVVLDGKGLLFAGHSEAGKSTMVTMLKGKAEILCDDRIIVRHRPDGFRIYGTWSHGDVPDVSAGSAPLQAILFLEQAQENCIMPLDNRQEVTMKLLNYLIKPHLTRAWWEKTLVLVEEIARNIPCYTLRFDKSGQVVDLITRQSIFL